MRALKIFGVVLAAFLIGYLIDWIANHEERAILAPIREAIAAIEKKDWAALEKTLEPDFEFGSSVSWVGAGRLEGARAKLETFWPRVSFFGVILREEKAESKGDGARAELAGNLKFQSASAGGFAIYKFRAVVQLRKSARDWKVFRIDLPQLEPGIF